MGIKQIPAGHESDLRRVESGRLDVPGGDIVGGAAIPALAAALQWRCEEIEKELDCLLPGRQRMLYAMVLALYQIELKRLLATAPCVTAARFARESCGGRRGGS